MGQAKERGTREDRVAQAAAEADRLRPPEMKCNVCSATLKDVSALETRTLPGIHAGFSAHCSACDQDTWAVRGDPAAVRAFYAALEKSAGASVRFGTARPAASS